MYNTSQFKIKIYKYQTDTDKTLIFKFERHHQSIIYYSRIYGFNNSSLLLLRTKPINV